MKDLLQGAVTNYNARTGEVTIKLTVDHIGRRCLPLCRDHHDEYHRIGATAFADKYHVVYTVRIDDKIAKVYKLRSKK